MTIEKFVNLINVIRESNLKIKGERIVLQVLCVVHNKKKCKTNNENTRVSVSASEAELNVEIKVKQIIA